MPRLAPLRVFLCSRLLASLAYTLLRPLYVPEGGREGCAVVAINTFFDEKHIAQHNTKKYLVFFISRLNTSNVVSHIPASTIVTNKISLLLQDTHYAYDACRVFT